MSDFKSAKKGSNIICRVSNATPEMVCKYVSRLPKKQMSESAFRDYMGKGWFQNEHQAPEQWGLYYIDGVNYYPRFTEDITLREAERYLKGWMKRLIVINPYTRFKNTCDKPMVKAIVEYMESHPEEHDLKTIFAKIIGGNEAFIINDIIANALNNFAELFTITTIDKENEKFDIVLNENYKEILDTKYNMTKKEYFDSFNDIQVKSLLDKEDWQVIYYGAPGTGKSHQIKDLIKKYKIDEKTNVFRTTFHPDSDYSTFVGAYKPTQDRMPITDEKGQPVIVGQTTLNKEQIVYKFIPQAFLKAYMKAWNCPNEAVVLVIEEINRGNCAQIFGDLFQLLDRKNGISEYPIKADDDIVRFLKFGKDEDHNDVLANKIGIMDDELRLPSNLYIWATMNTSDQSLFPIDSAFKRRWDWEYVPIKYNNADWTIKIGTRSYGWVTFQRKINELIKTATESEDKQLGDYFVKADANNIISAKLLLNKIIFYLWNDVCKDGDGDIFKIQESVDDETTTDITFSQFFVDTDTKLQQWMRYLGIEPIQSVDDSSKEDEERQAQIEAGTEEKDAQKVKYSKPIYKAIIENMIGKLEGQTLAFFPNGFDWAFTDMPKSYTRTTLTLDSNANTAYVKLWIPAASGYSNSRECFEYLKERNGETIIKDIAEKNGLQIEELGKKSTNPKPVLGWSMKLPMEFTEENTSANAEKLLQLMTDVRSAFDPIITDFQNK